MIRTTNNQLVMRLNKKTREKLIRGIMSIMKCFTCEVIKQIN